MKENEYSFYYLKVGFSNSLLKSARSKTNENKANMWIGYQHISMNELTKHQNPQTGFFPKDLKLQKVGSDETASPADLLALAAMSHHKNRDTIRIITFSQEHLEVWKIEDDLKIMNDEVADQITDYFQEKQDTLMQTMGLFGIPSKNNKKQNLTKEERMALFKKECFSINSKYIQLSRVFVCSRIELPPTINSLSVYQGFSRGTFRAIASANADKEEMLKNVFKNDAELAHIKTSTGDTYQERRFGFFIRKYLSFLMNPNAKDFFSELGISKTDSMKLLLYTLNPGQMESAAMLLVTDLGFVPEIGIAHALDSIDIRGRIPEAFSAKDILNRIKKLGLKLNKPIEDKILTDRVLEIQCKAYQYKSSDARQDIIYFTPASMENFTGINWSLELLQEKFDHTNYLKDKNADWYLLNNWLLNIKDCFKRKADPNKQSIAA